MLTQSSCVTRLKRAVTPCATKLDRASHPLALEPAVNEKLLLHGTKPPLIPVILSNGLNERFSGGLFGTQRTRQAREGARAASSRS